MGTLSPAGVASQGPPFPEEQRELHPIEPALGVDPVRLVVDGGHDDLNPGVGLAGRASVGGVGKGRIRWAGSL